MEKFIAIIQTGTALPEVFKEHSDFNDMFIHAMEINKSAVKTYRVFENLTFPDSDLLAGIIITGSSAMVTEKRDWSEQTINWLKTIIDKEIPVLGVCYGHQMLAKLLGGKVDWNPKGREIGTVNCDMTDKGIQDKLFINAIDANNHKLITNATHQQSVTKLPENVTLLGVTNIDANHCFRYKNHVWGLQFHPEFTDEIIKIYINCRADDIISEGLNPQDIIKAVKANTAGKQILQNFKHLCMQH